MTKHIAADTLDDGAPRGGRDGQGDCFQAAIGARAGGLKVGEEQAFPAQAVEIGRQLTWVAKTAQVAGAQAFDGDQNDIQRARLTGIVDLSADIQRVSAEETGAWFGQFGTQLAARGLCRQAAVELIVVQLVVTEGGEELDRKSVV